MDKKKWKYVDELVRILSIIIGIVMGAGLLFIGVTKPNSIVIFLAIISILTGLVVVPTLIKETDEYETIP